MTASTAYSTVSTMTDVAASNVLTLGETPFAVVIRPNTAQGWRPISVKIQPKELPETASTGMASAIAPNQRLVGVRPLRVSQRISAAPAAASEADADHEAERPVGHRNVRHVVAGGVVRRARVLPVLLLVLRPQVVDALDLAVEGAGGEERQQVRDLDRELLAGAVRGADGEDGEGRGLLVS